MKIVVTNGSLSEKELDACIRRATEKHPASAIDKLILEVHEDYVDLRCTLHRCRELRKMSGYCISEPAAWNSAKRAEYRDMTPNRFGEES